MSDGVVTWSLERIVFAIRRLAQAYHVTNPTVRCGSIRHLCWGGAVLAVRLPVLVGPGGYGWSSSISGTNSFSQADINTINAISGSFESDVETRGQPSGFSRWGGAITFDTSGSTHGSLTTRYLQLPVTTDFYSVAIHELAHALGFGAGQHEFDRLALSQWLDVYRAPMPKALQWQVNVPLSADKAHWANGTDERCLWHVDGARSLDGSRCAWTARGKSSPRSMRLH